MPKNSGDLDEAENTMDLDGAGNKDGTKNATRQRRRLSRNKRVKIIGIMAAVIIVIVIIVGAWFIYTSTHTPANQGRSEWLITIPGLDYHPNDVKDDSLISFKAYSDDFRPWVDEIQHFLEVYKRPGLVPGRGQMISRCDYDRLPFANQVCDVDVKNWFPCVAENNFNYHRSSPCIFIKMKEIYDWIPEYYNDTNNLPEKMPQQLKEHILEQKQTNPQLLNTIWVSCDGESPADIENVGPIRYIPRQGFPGYFYPYKGLEGYLSPLIAIHFEHPRTGIVLNIECKAWARNIVHDGQVGMVHFQLKIN